MRKLLIALILMAFIPSLFISCQVSDEKLKAYKAQKIYFEKFTVYDNVDSTSSCLTIYVGEVKGHKMMYQIFDGKFKSQMEVWHMTDECKACQKK